MSEPRPAFPWSVVVLGGAVLALGYLPTLFAPFDFIDDGNLVYPAPPGTSTAGFVDRWWDKVADNVDHLGPFRPTLWAHWELAANTFDGNPLAWRTWRMVWCGLAAAALLWLMKELKLHPAAALIAAAAAMWNPYRNEIWTSLTLAEGVAMPYALAALAAARRGAGSSRPWPWDVVAIASLFVCLGCKNTFVALVPAMIGLRLLPDGQTLREGWRRGRWAAAVYLIPLAMPAAHFVYFRLHWHPGQYETPGPSLVQVERIALWMKGASALDFIGLGMLAAVVVMGIALRRSPGTIVPGLLRQYRATVLASALLLTAGVAVYLPLAMMAPRYTMPAIWGWDVLVALTFTLLMAVPLTHRVRFTWATVAVGLAVMTVANVSRQEKVSARGRMLWAALERLEQTAPPGSRIAWVGGDSETGALNIEEGIHFQWHLTHRGRGDLRVGLYDEHGLPVDRVELPEVDGPPHFRIAAGPATVDGWRPDREFAGEYRFGRKRFECRLDVAPAVDTGPTLYADPWVAGFMRTAFENPGTEHDYLRRLTRPANPGRSPTAQLTGTPDPARPADEAP